MAVHVSHAALPFPVKGARYSFYVPYLDADGDPTAPTTPDTELSKDAAAAADCAEEASAVSGMDGMALMTLTGDEMNCSGAALNAKVASGPKATLMTFYPRVLPPLKDHPTGTAQAGAAGTITLQSTAPTFDLAGCIVKTTGGTGGAGGSGSLNNQARVITAYNGSTKVATVEPNWETTPDNTTTYAILLTDMFNPSGAADALLDELLSSALHNVAGSVGQSIRRASAIGTDGSVNDAAATTTTFIIGGSVTVDDFYNDQVLVFTTGALAGQSKPVLDYVGATKTITLSEALTSAPANGVEFVLIPTHVHPVSQLVQGVFGESLPGAYGAGTAGKIIGDNLNAPVGDVPTNAELATALAAADDAVLAAIAALNNLSSAGAQAAATAALTAYGAATSANVAAVEADTQDLQVQIGVDGAGLTAIGDIRLANLDATVSSRSVLAAADVWAYGTRTLSSYGTLIADIWTGLTAGAANRIADHTWRRNSANIEASSDGDSYTFRSPFGMVRKLTNKLAIIVGILTAYEEDDTTVAGQQTVTTDPAAEHVTGLDTA